MKTNVLSGFETIAQGAIDGGVTGIYHYHGNLSDRIIDCAKNIQTFSERTIQFHNTINEQTALQAAFGMSYSGKRSVVCIQNSGLNIASNDLFNSSFIGINGGLVITVVDDVQLDFSQTSRDPRLFGKLAMTPVLEPANNQEAYDMIYDSFKLSEKIKLPVIIRLAIHLLESNKDIERRTQISENKISFVEDYNQYILHKNDFYKRYKILNNLQTLLEQESEVSQYNVYIPGRNKSLGIIACGYTYNYLMENYKTSKCPYPILQIGQYPLPYSKLEKIVDNCDSILVLETGYPLVEELLRGYLVIDSKIMGKLNGTIPRDEKLSTEVIAKIIGLKQDVLQPKLFNHEQEVHSSKFSTEIFNALNLLKHNNKGLKIFIDTNCYSENKLSDESSVISCANQGTSISMAKGLVDSEISPVIAVSCISNFTHSGITSLLDCVSENSPLKVILIDNTDINETPFYTADNLEKLLTGLSIETEHIRKIKKSKNELTKVLQKEIEYKGLSVTIICE